DVARVVSHELGAREARLAVTAIASQMRRYPAQSVDERWEAQLRSLGADVWWADDETWLGGWGDREQQDRGSVVLAAVRVLNLLVGLPVLPTLCPPPGTARRQAGRPVRSAGDLRVLDRVRALLAKAESTEFTEEADALTAKAQQLIAQH
nr:DUF2786 domain-containing protein [Micromonospora sp. DSM 115978]